MAERALEDQVQRLRAAILARHGHDSAPATPEGATGSPIERVERLARVSAHWGIASDIPVVGRLLVLVRRATRIGLRWYINPIVEQQNAFNDAVVTALHELAFENEALRAKLRERTSSPSSSESTGNQRP